MPEDMPENPEVLKIVKEDILEELGKRDKGALLTEVKPEIKVSHTCISRAIEELRSEGLIQVKNKRIFLTGEGMNKAELLGRKHSILEDYFSRSRDEEDAWKAASFLEHYISKEVIDKLKEISTLKEDSSPLTEVKQKEGLITDIIFDTELFERMVSMGIFPGKKIEIVNRIADSVIVEIGQKKFVLAKEIVEGIKVLPDERY